MRGPASTAQGKSKAGFQRIPRVPVFNGIQGLKKGGGGRERWLMTVLRGRPELQDLARRAEHELTGK